MLEDAASVTPGPLVYDFDQDSVFMALAGAGGPGREMSRFHHDAAVVTSCLDGVDDEVGEHLAELSGKTGYDQIA